MNPSYVGAYWGSRRETAREGGERLARCVDALSSAGLVLTSWFRRGASRAAATTPVDLDPESLGRLLVQGANRRDVNGEVIEELGFSLGLWNRQRPAVGLAAHVGSHSAHPGILNSFVLNIPSPDDDAEALYRLEAATAVFKAVVESWEPEWATWTTYEWRDAQSPVPREPVVGWLTYLRGVDMPVAPGGTSRSLAGGVLIQAAPEFIAVDEATVLTIRQHLQRSAGLRPIA